MKEPYFDKFQKERNKLARIILTICLLILSVPALILLFVIWFLYFGEV